MTRYPSKFMIGLLVALTIGLVACLGSAASSDQEQSEVENAWAKYEIILQRNIFSRNRAPARQVETSQEEETPRVMPNPESYYKLTGIVQEDGVFIAFVEDRRYNSMLRLRQGDSVARGIVKSLTLDSIQYEYDGKTVGIEIGKDLEGGFGAVTQNELMQWTPTDGGTTSGSTSTSSEPATGDEADILKQLMQRRQQQLGR